MLDEEEAELNEVLLGTSAHSMSREEWTGGRHNEFPKAEQSDGERDVTDLPPPRVDELQQLFFPSM